MDIDYVEGKGKDKTRLAACPYFNRPGHVANSNVAAFDRQGLKR